MGSPLRDALAGLAEALFPRHCAVCGAQGEEGPWCAAHRLPCGPAGSRCPTCAARLPRALADEARCARCRREPPRLARVLVLADYRHPALREWILAFKHGGRRELAAPLGAALAAHAARSLNWSADGVRRVLCPVPLHRWRRVERGYDQARLLAEVLARDLGAPLVAALVRVRATAVQGAGGARSRTSNVRGAFAVRRSWADRWSAAGVLGELRAFRSARRALAAADEVWLVDDVITSGSTLRECARALRRAGARRVAALALARAEGLREPEAPAGPDAGPDAGAREVAGRAGDEPRDLDALEGLVDPEAAARDAEPDPDAR